MLKDDLICSLLSKMAIFFGKNSEIHSVFAENKAKNVEFAKKRCYN